MPSFGDIFHDNAYQNGLLPLRLDMVSSSALPRHSSNRMRARTVDLVNSKLLIARLKAIPFELPDNRRALLLDGLDQLSFILASSNEIDELEIHDALSRPWVYTSPP